MATILDFRIGMDGGQTTLITDDRIIAHVHAGTRLIDLVRLAMHADEHTAATIGDGSVDDVLRDLARRMPGDGTTLLRS